MANNDPVQDRYSPPSITQYDFDEYNFEDLEINELFWLTTDPLSDMYKQYRKVTENTATGIKDRVEYNFVFNRKVYLKT